MQVVAAPEFVPRQFPQPLDPDAIHLWFFPHWPGPFHAVAQSPRLLALLGAYAGCGTADLRIERGEHGKPRLRNVALEFNLSHSGTTLLLGLSRQQALGVDIEARPRARPVLELARRWFDADEVTALEALPESLQHSAFLQLWCCKEAVLKAHGRGIGYGLDHVAFDLDAGADIANIRRIGGAATSPAWQVRRLAPQQGMTGALAWCGPAHTVSAFVADADHIDADHISGIEAGL